MIDRCMLRRCLLIAICKVSISSGVADGAGFALMEQSVKQMGNAHAGGAAAAEDASAVAYNPAGLTRLPGSQFVAGVNLLLPSARFGNNGSTDLAGQPLVGNGGDAGGIMAVPQLYYSVKMNDRITLGLGVFSPFGLSTEYDRGWAGRYHAVKSDLASLNINPAVAFRITDNISVGGGLSAQYIRGKLSNAIDFGGILASLGAVGMAPQQQDGFVVFTGDSWSWGYNLGVLYEFNNHSRLGAAYRSPVEHTIRGDADFSGVPAPNLTGRFLDTGIRADVTMPGSASLSLWHDVTEELAVMADVTWTDWSRFRELRIRFDNSAETDAVTTYNWRDTWRYSAGAAYYPGPWVFRAGVAYDESSVPDAAHRSPRIPDNDRIWLAGGVGCRMTDGVSVDLGYAHLFVKDAGIAKTATGEDLFRGALNGSYRSHVDIVSAEITWRF